MDKLADEEINKRLTKLVEDKKAIAAELNIELKQTFGDIIKC